MAEELGDLDELFRVYANLTTVLDLAGRHEDAVAVAVEGIEAARSAGLEAVYGNFLRGNAADSLFLLGRWQEARAMSMTALEWLPAGVNFLNTLVALATVEIELSAGEVAGRLLGRTLLELEAVPDPQQAVPLHLAAASFALWRGDIADARRASDRGWALVRETEDWILAARTAATAIEVQAAAAAEAREKRDLASLAGAREHAHDVLRSAETTVRRHGVASSLGSRRLADAWLATARAQRRRVDARDDPAAWATVAGDWASLGIPYETARARWREAAARLGSGAGRAGRADARKPLLEAARIALDLGALPLLRELRELAGRALITLPTDVDDRLASPEDKLPDAIGERRGTGRRRPGPGQSTAREAGSAGGNGHDGAAIAEALAGVPEAPEPRRHVRLERPRARGARRRSPGAARTARSASGCSSARRPSGSTSGTSWRSSACRAGSRPPPWRSAWDSRSPGHAPARREVRAPRRSGPGRHETRREVSGFRWDRVRRADEAGPAGGISPVGLPAATGHQRQSERDDRSDSDSQVPDASESIVSHGDSVWASWYRWGDGMGRPRGGTRTYPDPWPTGNPDDGTGGSWAPTHRAPPRRVMPTG